MTSPAVPASWELIRHPATGLALPVPPGWQALCDAGAPVVLTAPPVSAGPGGPPPFVPNVVGTVDRPRPQLAQLADYTAASMARLHMQLADLHVIAADAVDIAGHEGRRMLCGYLDGIFAVTSEYWWVIADGVATTLAASCQVEQYLDASPVFENIAAGLIPATRSARTADRGASSPASSEDHPHLTTAARRNGTRAGIAVTGSVTVCGLMLAMLPVLV
jgi:hypothetical protein